MRDPKSVNVRLEHIEFPNGPPGSIVLSRKKRSRLKKWFFPVIRIKRISTEKDFSKGLSRTLSE